MNPLIGLASACALCAFTLLLLNDFEGAFLAAVGGAVLYVAQEVVRRREDET